MYPIERVEPLNAEVTRMVVRAPEIARKIRPGQFIMLRIDERGERIPLTMNECDPEAGTVTIVFQAVGATTMRLAQLKAGDALLDFAGPLGNPTELEGARRACVIGGGLGTAIAYPQAKWLHEHGCEVDVITGFRKMCIRDSAWTSPCLRMCRVSIRRSTARWFPTTGAARCAWGRSDVYKRQLRRAVARRLRDPANSTHHSPSR